MIGVFDSGVGGLSIWREIVQLLPHEPLLYLADQAHVPYGQRSLDDVRSLTSRNVGWLIARGCDIVVIACNTASAAALHHVRACFPRVPFVGMEPAVKPAALGTRTGVIGVLATHATFQSELFASVVARFAAGTRVVQQPCPGWVELVEAGIPPERLTDESIAQYVDPLLAAGADALVLGCTHFPFLAPHIQAAADRWAAQHACSYDIALVDPSMAVARQVMRVRNNLEIEVPGASEPVTHGCDGAHPVREFWTTGDPDAFACVAAQLVPPLGLEAAPAQVPTRVPTRAPTRANKLSPHDFLISE